MLTTRGGVRRSCGAGARVFLGNSALRVVRHLSLRVSWRVRVAAIQLGLTAHRGSEHSVHPPPSALPPSPSPAPPRISFMLPFDWCVYAFATSHIFHTNISFPIALLREYRRRGVAVFPLVEFVRNKAQLESLFVLVFSV